MDWLLRLLQAQRMKEAGADGDDGGGSAGNATPSDNPTPQSTENAPKAADKSDESKGTDDEKAALIKDLMKWKSKAREYEGQLKGLSDQVQTLNQFKEALGDLSLDQLKELVSQHKDAERQALEKKGEYERIVKQMKEENEKVVSTLRTQLEDLQTKLQGAQAEIHELTVGRAFRDSEFVREKSMLTPAIAQREFGPHFDFVDGQLIAYDKPRGAKDRTMMVDAHGEPLSFEAAIEKLHQKHPDAKHIIRSQQKPGAGSRSEPVNSGATEDVSQLRGIDKIRAGLSRGKK